MTTHNTAAKTATSMEGTGVPYLQEASPGTLEEQDTAALVVGGGNPPSCVSSVTFRDHWETLYPNADAVALSLAINHESTDEVRTEKSEGPSFEPAKDSKKHPADAPQQTGANATTPSNDSAAAITDKKSIINAEMKNIGRRQQPRSPLLVQEKAKTVPQQGQVIRCEKWKARVTPASDQRQKKEGAATTSPMVRSPPLDEEEEEEEEAPRWVSPRTYTRNTAITVGTGSPLGTFPIPSTNPFPEEPHRPPVVASQPGAFAVGSLSTSMWVDQNDSLTNIADVDAEMALLHTLVQDEEDLPVDANVAQEPNEECLAVANPVREEADAGPHDLPFAHELDDAQEQARRKHQQTQNACILGIMACVVLAVVVALLPLFLETHRNSENERSKTILPSLKPTQAPTVLPLEEYINDLLPEYTLEAITQATSSPQSLAYLWLLNDPAMINRTLSDRRILQRYALATFYYATGGPSWMRNDAWLSYEQHECSWYAKRDYGISYGDLNYSFYPNPCNMGPTDPNPEGIYQHLWQWQNNLQGTIPRELYWLTSLRTISMYANPALSGSIPSTIGLLSDLKGLNMGATKLTGSIPSEIGLTGMSYLTFFDTELKSTLPTELGTLSSELKFLFINNRQLTGTIPSELFNCDNLEVLILSNSGLSGSIPTTIAAASPLSILYLDDCSLTGSIPSEIGLLTNLVDVALEKNLLSGAIPDAIGNGLLLSSSNSSLLRFNVTDNPMLSGSIPDGLCYYGFDFDCSDNLCGCGCNCEGPN